MLGDAVRGEEDFEVTGISQEGADLVLDMWILTRNDTCDVFFEAKDRRLIRIDPIGMGVIALRDTNIEDLAISVIPRHRLWPNNEDLDIVN